MTGGMIIREAHFPGRAPIDAYGNGGFRFAGMSHRGSILCLPSGIHGWEPADPENLGEEDFARVIAEAAEVEVLAKQWSWGYRFPGKDGVLRFGRARPLRVKSKPAAGKKRGKVNKDSPFAALRDLTGAHGR